MQMYMPPVLGCLLAFSTTASAQQFDPYFEQWEEGSFYNLIGEGIVEAGCTVTEQELLEIIQAAMDQSGNETAQELGPDHYIMVLVGNLTGARQQGVLDDETGALTLKGHKGCE